MGAAVYWILQPAKLSGRQPNQSKSFRAMDLLASRWLLEDFRAVLNDTLKVNVNIFTEGNVQVYEEDGKNIPLQWRGDCCCTREEIDAMLVHRKNR